MPILYHKIVCLVIIKYNCFFRGEELKHDELVLVSIFGFVLTNYTLFIRYHQVQVREGTGIK